MSDTPDLTINGAPGTYMSTGSEPDWATKIPDHGQAPADPGLTGGIKNDDSIANIVFSNPNDPVTNTLGSVVRGVSDAKNSLNGIGAGQNMGQELATMSSDETGYHGKIDTRLKTMYGAWLSNLGSDVKYVAANSSKLDNARTVTASFNNSPENSKNIISHVIASSKDINVKEPATVMIIPGNPVGMNQGNLNDYNITQNNTGSALKKAMTSVGATLNSLDTAIKTTKANQHSFISQELKSTQASQISGIANTTEDGTSELGDQPVPGVSNALPANINKSVDVLNLGVSKGKVDGLIKQGVQQLGNGLSNAFGSMSPVNNFGQLSSSGSAQANVLINKPGSNLNDQLNNKLHSDVLNNLSSPVLRGVSNKIDSNAKNKMNNMLGGISNAGACAALTSNMGSEYGVVPKDTIVFSTSGQDDTELINKINSSIESANGFGGKTFSMKIIYGV